MKTQGGYPIYGNDIGILMLDLKAPLLPGKVGNARSYDFPVRYKVMKGLPADWWCDEQGPDEERCRLFIQYVKELAAEGVKAITTGCGYFAIYQKTAAKELSIPLFASPLLMAPMISRMLPENKKAAGHPLLRPDPSVPGQLPGDGVGGPQRHPRGHRRHGRRPGVLQPVRHGGKAHGGLRPH